MVKPGAHFGDIGYAIQQYVGPTGCSIVREFRWSRRGEEVSTKNLCRNHVGKMGEGPEMKPGMIFTIEPMINAGKHALKIMPNGWTAVTKDRSLSRTMGSTRFLVTETGYEVLTVSPGCPQPPLAGLSNFPRASENGGFLYPISYASENAKYCCQYNELEDKTLKNT